MTTKLIAYKVQSPNSPKIYIGVTTTPFKRLLGIMKSRFAQYLYTTDAEKKKRYHHVCFEILESEDVCGRDLLERKMIVILEEYDCTPTDDIKLMKQTFMAKHTTDISPDILIKPKRPLKPEYKRIFIDRRYREKNKEKNNTKQREKYECEICRGKYTRANKYNHLLTTKHTQAVFRQIVTAVVPTINNYD